LGVVLAAPTAAAAGPSRPSVDLAVTMTDSPDPVTQGNELTYTIGVRNKGKSAATEVALDDPISAPLVSVTTSQGSCTTSVTCALGSIPAGGSATVLIVVRADPVFPSNTASVSSAEADKVSSNNTASAKTTIEPDPYAPRTFTAPYATSGQNGICSEGTTPETCFTGATTSTSGDLAVDALIDDTQPSDQFRYAQAAASVSAFYELAAPAQALRVTIDARVQDAEAIEQIAGGGEAEVFLRGRLDHNTCSECEVVVSDTTIVSSPELTGSRSEAHDLEITLSLELSSSSGSLPTGWVEIQSSLIALSYLSLGAGSARATGSATVTGITATPQP
jgi:uncharacterized repeat protein (TIGR01451 family)